MRKRIMMVLVTVVAVSAFPSAAIAGPCGNLGDVCYEIIHRPLNQLCNGNDLCPQ